MIQPVWVWHSLAEHGAAKQSLQSIAGLAPPDSERLRVTVWTIPEEQYFKNSSIESITGILDI